MLLREFGKQLGSSWEQRKIKEIMMGNSWEVAKNFPFQEGIKKQPETFDLGNSWEQ